MEVSMTEALPDFGTFNAFDENIAEIWLTAEKLLFAESLINFLLFENLREPFKIDIHGSYRVIVPNHFNYSVENLVREMDMMLDNEMEIILGTYELNEWTHRKYMSIVTLVYENISELDGDKESKIFICNCTLLTKLAVHLYKEGVSESLRFALSAILYGLKSWTIYNRNWLKLQAESNELLHSMITEENESEENTDLSDYDSPAKEAKCYCSLHNDSSEDEVFEPMYYSTPLQPPSTMKESPRSNDGSSKIQMSRNSSEAQTTEQKYLVTASIPDCQKNEPESLFFAKHDRNARGVKRKLFD